MDFGVFPNLRWLFGSNFATSLRDEALKWVITGILENDTSKWNKITQVTLWREFSLQGVFCLLEGAATGVAAQMNTVAVVLPMVWWLGVEGWGYCEKML